MDTFEASSPADLDSKVRANDVRVPGRMQGRTTEKRETWIACRFLATVARSDLLQFPVRVEHGDRPDLVLSRPNGRIGVEIVEAISTDQAKVDAIVERDGSSGFRPLPRYRASDRPRSRAEIRALARGEFQMLPRMGDSVERDWAEAVLYVVARKAVSFHKPGFARHPTNWLLVYDNWQPLSALNEELAAERLNGELSGGRQSHPFGKVFVQRPRVILAFGDGLPPVRYRIPESWLACFQNK